VCHVLVYYVGTKCGIKKPLEYQDPGISTSNRGLGTFYSCFNLTLFHMHMHRGKHNLGSFEMLVVYFTLNTYVPLCSMQGKNYSSNINASFQRCMSGIVFYRNLYDDQNKPFSVLEIPRIPQWAKADPRHLSSCSTVSPQPRPVKFSRRLGPSRWRFCPCV